MNATDVLTEPAALHDGSAAGDNAPDARARGRHMTIRHLGMAPCIHPDAYVAPTAVLSGQVSIGAWRHAAGSRGRSRQNPGGDAPALGHVHAAPRIRAQGHGPQFHQGQDARN